MLVSFDKDFCKVPENLFAACLAASDLLSNERTDVGKKENMRMPNVKFWVYIQPLYERLYGSICFSGTLMLGES